MKERPGGNVDALQAEANSNRLHPAESDPLPGRSWARKMAVEFPILPTGITYAIPAQFALELMKGP